MAIPTKKILFILLIFIFSFSLRVITINDAGRTWDEFGYIITGVKYVEHFAKGDLTNEVFWSEGIDHPPLGKYIYGLSGVLDLVTNSPEKIFHYDLTFSRLVSIIFSSLTVVLTTLIGWRYMNFFTGIAAGVILSMLPYFVGISSQATLETLIIFFYTGAVFSFLFFLEKKKKRYLLLSGILSGLTFSVKETGILVVGLILLIGLLHLRASKTSYKNLIKEIFTIFVVTTFIFVAMSPLRFVHYEQYWDLIYGLWLSPSVLPTPEVFFGKMMLVPKAYYFVFFLITTPLLVLLSLAGGLLRIDREKKWHLYALVIWLVFPFILSFYNVRQNGVRYIIEFYVPLSLIAAYGLDSFIKHFARSYNKQVLLLALCFLYMLFTLIKIQPYYLNYYNGLVGGTKSVYEKRLFHIGWWGDGGKAVLEYFNREAPKGSTIAFQTNPHLTFMPEMTKYPTKNLKFVKYEQDKNYDYVVVNYYSELREGFSTSELKPNYMLIHTVWADGAKLVKIYKHK